MEVLLVVGHFSSRSKLFPRKLTTLRVVLKRECLAHNAQDCLWQSLASKSTKNVLIQAYNACYCKKALFYKLSGGMAQ